jgi:hypothetical protein
VALYGYETWSLTLREEHKLRVFENRALKRIFGPMTEIVTEGWRKLHKEELHDLYSSPSISRINKLWTMRWAGYVARMGRKGTCIGLAGKPEGKRPLGRPRRMWINNIKMEVLEIGLSVVDWIGLAQDRYSWRALVNAVMNLLVPQNSVKLTSGCTTFGLRSSTQLHRVVS